MKQNEESMGFPEMFEALKDLIASKNKEGQSNKALLIEIAKRLDAIEKAVNPLTTEQREKLAKSRTEYYESVKRIANVAKSDDAKLNQIADNQLRLVQIWHKMLKPKCTSNIWRLIYRICHKPLNSMVCLAVETIGVLAFFLGISAFSQSYWKDVAKQNVENSVKYRFIRAKDWASLNMIQWLDSVYNVHDDDMINRIEQQAMVYEFKQQKHFDHVIRDSQRKKQQMH